MGFQVGDIVVMKGLSDPLIVISHDVDGVMFLCKGDSAEVNVCKTNLQLIKKKDEDLVHAFDEHLSRIEPLALEAENLRQELHETWIKYNRALGAVYQNLALKHSEALYASLRAQAVLKMLDKNKSFNNFKTIKSESFLSVQKACEEANRKVNKIEKLRKKYLL